jgi:hypothetical protein
MDHVTRQFINLTKKLRDDARKSLKVAQQNSSRLVRILEKQADAIGEQKQAEEKSHDDSIRFVRGELSTPVPIRVESDSRERHPNWKKVKTGIEILGIGAAIFYGYMVLRQLREMIAT